VLSHLPATQFQGMEDGGWSVIEATDAGAKPLQVMCVDAKSDTVSIQEDNLKVVNDILQETGADAVSIIAIMGTYRTGKSFLLSLLMRYLRCLERAMKQQLERDANIKAARSEAEANARFSGLTAEEVTAAGDQAEKDVTARYPDADFPPPQHEQWRLRGPEQPLPEWTEAGSIGPAEKAKVLGQEGFTWKGGAEKCTEGIWFWSRPFVFPHEGRKIAVLLMDTQGAWDGQMTKEQNATIFGITALLASRLIVNLQNMLSDDKVDHIDFFTTFAQNACSGLTHEGPPFGHIEFLLRDWSHYKKGFSFQDCKAMMEEHLETILHSKVAGRAETAERLAEIYSSMSCSGLTHPGLSVLDSDFTGDFEDISNDFFHLLDDFARNFFGAQHFPRASAPLGIEISPSTFENVIRNFNQAFSDNRSSAVSLREAFVSCEVFKTRDVLMTQFKQRLALVAPENRVVDPISLDEKSARIRAETFKEFEAKIKSFKLQDEAEEIAKFHTEVVSTLTHRRKQNQVALEGAQMKLFLWTPAAGGVVYFWGGFITGHPITDAALAAGITYFAAQKHAARVGGNVLHPEVIKNVHNDARSFAARRASDMQAMSVAAQTCSPGIFAERAKLVAGHAITGGAQVAAAASNNNNEPQWVAERATLDAKMEAAVAAQAAAAASSSKP